MAKKLNFSKKKERKLDFICYISNFICNEINNYLLSLPFAFLPNKSQNQISQFPLTATPWNHRRRCSSSSELLSSSPPETSDPMPPIIVTRKATLSPSTPTRSAHFTIQGKPKSQLQIWDRWKLIVDYTMRLICKKSLRVHYIVGNVLVCVCVCVWWICV